MTTCITIILGFTTYFIYLFAKKMTRISRNNNVLESLACKFVYFETRKSVGTQS